MFGQYVRASMRGNACLLVLLSLPLALPLVGASRAAAQQGGPASVVVATIVDRPIVAERSFIGTTQATRTSVVGSAVDGRVMEVLKEEGDSVTQGELLVSLRTGTVEIALRAAEAELSLRRSELEEMTNGSRPEEVSRAEAEYATSEALWDYAKSALDRTESLYERGQTISRDEYEERLSIANAARQRLLAAQAELELVQAGVRVEQIAQAESRLAMSQAEVDRIQDLIEKYTIEAPYDGYVVTKHAEVGQWIRSGEPVVEIVRIDPIDIEVYVPEIYIGNVELHSQVEVTFDSMPGQPLPGEISRIVPRADLQSRTFPVLVRLGNADNRLKAGMLGQVRLPVERRESALLVPKDALVLGGPTPVLYVLVPGTGDNATVRPVPVQTGLETGSLIQVIGDIEAGQQVVVEGNERIFGGNAVKIAEEMVIPE